MGESGRGFYSVATMRQRVFSAVPLFFVALALASMTSPSPVVVDEDEFLVFLEYFASAEDINM